MLEQTQVQTTVVQAGGEEDIVGKMAVAELGKKMDLEEEGEEFIDRNEYVRTVRTM